MKNLIIKAEKIANDPTTNKILAAQILIYVLILKMENGVV